MHVLVVDDSERLRTLLAAVLEAAGCQVEMAADGLSGLERFIHAPPDVIVTDVNMPGMDGLTFVERVRGRPEGRRLPIFVLSSDDCPGKRERAQAFGVSLWMEKPTDLAAMAAEVLRAAA